jgi:glyoxylase-like metal-dependent hydrolase (beta-lactamase superfamily II)
MKTIDLQFQGLRRVIATAVLEGPSGVALIDPGPTSTLPALEAGLQEQGHALSDVKAILLTHIHLDHAGASGTLAATLPGVPVYVHERGAPHMVDPKKLMASAARLYGDQMERLWGEMRPVPAEQARALAGGERLELAGRTLEVAYTPGHASHHVSYLDHTSGVAYVGDTVGIRTVSDYIVAPTPPPDIDLDAWRASVAQIHAWQPDTLFLTHFGPFAAPSAHLADMLDRLERLALSTRRLLDEAPANAEGRADEARQQRFVEELRRELRRHVDETTVQRYALAVPFEHCWLGLARYWRKRA